MRNPDFPGNDFLSTPLKIQLSYAIQKVTGLVRLGLPILLLTGEAACQTKPEELHSIIQVPEELKPKLTFERPKGNWKFDVMETSEEVFQLQEGQENFQDYLIVALLKSSGADLSNNADLEAFSSVYFDIIQQLNPNLDLKNTQSILGQKIILPTKVFFTPREGKFFRGRVGYEYLRDATRADGMNISDPTQRDEIYQSACKLPLMPDSAFYSCKDENSDCKEPCATHAQITYSKFASEFFQESGGVGLVYNDLMRDEEGEKEIVKSGKGGTQGGSTHITGSSLDQAVFRYIIDGVQVSYGKATDEQKKDIDTRLKPLLKKLLSEYFERGEILVVDETHGNIPHYHLYFPKNVVPLHPQEINLNLSAELVVSQPQQKTFEEIKMHKGEIAGTSFYTFTVPDAPIKNMLDSLCGSSSQGTIDAIKKFNKKDHISPGDIIWIPVQFMKPELQDPTLVIVENPKNIDQGILNLYNPDHKEGGYRIPKALVKPQ